MMILTGRTIVSAIRPPYPYGGEFMGQFLFVLRLCWLPLMLSTVAVTYGAPGLQALGFLTVLGTPDRLGSFFNLAVTREFAPFICAIIVAGVAGTAITADLGARKVREELDQKWRHTCMTTLLVNGTPDHLRTVADLVRG